MVDVRDFYADLSEVDGFNLRKHGRSTVAAGPPRPCRFENCIEVRAASLRVRCQDETSFMGPAALAAIHNKMLESPPEETAFLVLADGERRAAAVPQGLELQPGLPNSRLSGPDIADLRGIVSAAEGDEK